MKSQNIHGIVFLILLFLFANQAEAEEWIYYASTPTRDAFYDKSSLKRVDRHIISVCTKIAFNDDGKKHDFSFLQSIGQAPESFDILNYKLIISEVDCTNHKIKDCSTRIYDKKNNVVYTSPISDTGKWSDIFSNSIGAKLRDMICKENVTSTKVSMTSQKAVISSVPVDDNNPSPSFSQQKEPKKTDAEAIQNMLSKWMASWEDGEIECYRSCYAPDFKSKGMNLDEWVDHKSTVYKKSKDIRISMDDLQISEQGDTATAVFKQSYRSSILQAQGKKTLELKKINGEWKIYREIM